jgi:hypothetical protein
MVAPSDRSPAYHVPATLATLQAMAIYTYAQLIAPTDQAAHKTAILTALEAAGFTGAFTWQSGASPLAVSSMAMHS